MAHLKISPGLSEFLEAHPPSLDDWDFTPVDTFLCEWGRDRCVMGVADDAGNSASGLPLS